jgi:hypothetical protein
MVRPGNTDTRTAGFPDFDWAEITRLSAQVRQQYGTFKEAQRVRMQGPEHPQLDLIEVGNGSQNRASVEAIVHNETMGKVIIAIVVIAVIAAVVWLVLSRRRG